MGQVEPRMTRLFCFIAVLCGHFVQGALGAQRFERQPEYSEVNPGQEARLTCKIFQKKGQCSWQKDNKPVGIYLGKYEWAGNPDVGDCSLRILNSVLEYDDGEWECQVTASDFAAQDALTSKPVKLVIRVAPDAPQIALNGTGIPVGKNLTTQSGVRTSVRCTSRNGNPAPLLKWFVGNDEVTTVSSQINKTEENNSKKWYAVSTLEYTFHKGHNGKTLRCVAVHEAYPTRSRETQVVMDVQYAPQVKLLGLPEGDLEENKSKLTLRCIADSNPPAQIIWKKTGGSQVFGYQEAIEFRPVVRKHSGAYTCEAKNFLGVTTSPSVEVDVKYPPKVIRVGPERMLMASLYNRTLLQCQAEGNPQPSYQWLQQMTPAAEATFVRGADHMLVIQNVTYDFQGKYICKASNTISGTERQAQSDSIELHVNGAPQILHHSIQPEIEVERGTEAKLTMIFCANPGPSKVIWDWGSLQLEAGYEMGRFSAESITKTTRDNCYEARLIIASADSSDTRHYYLKVENSRGSDKHSVSLQVRDPVSMSIVISVIVGCLVLLVTVVLVILYAFKAEKWCFSQHGEFKPTDLESEKSDGSGSTKVTVGDGQHITQNNGKTNSIPIPQNELHFGHHRTRMKSSGRNLDSANIPSDFHAMKQQQNQQPNFRARAYPAIIDATKKDINYSDLQLPRSSNNGSMKKSNKNHQSRNSASQQQQHHQDHTQHQSALTKQQLHQLNSAIPVLQTPNRRTSNGQAGASVTELHFTLKDEV